ncbi:MAG: hypothetical protein LQ347_007058 [Umbilicaria vellea]|nr:MAG: hypothetical protein LQ347_007058 [Umbilicaria vellea]
MLRRSPKASKYLKAAQEDRTPKDVRLSEEQRRQPHDQKARGLTTQEKIVGKQNRTRGKDIGIVQPVEEEERGKQAYVQGGMIKLIFRPPSTLNSWSLAWRTAIRAHMPDLSKQIADEDEDQDVSGTEVEASKSGCDVRKPALDVQEI